MTRTGAAIQDAPIAAQFDTLIAAEALEDAGIDRTHAKAIAAQLQVASDAGEPVSRPALEAALGALKAELLERIGKTDERIASTEKNLLERIAETERRLMDRTAALLWRFFGAMVALAGVIIAAVKLIP